MHHRSIRPLEIAIFNINGLRARLGQLLEWLEHEGPDVVCLQELKTPDERFPASDLERAGYGALWRGQAAWSGVTILARGEQPRAVRRALPGFETDTHNRYLEVSVAGLLIASLYLPNDNPQPGPKFDYKLAWFDKLIEHAATMVNDSRPVVLAGNYNVVLTDEDIYNPRSWLKDALLQPQSRQRYAQLLAQGWTDARRVLHPDKRNYTFWDDFRQHWQTHSGLRIEHLLLNRALAPALTAAEVDIWGAASHKRATMHRPGLNCDGIGTRTAGRHTPSATHRPNARTETRMRKALDEYTRKRDFDTTPEPPMQTGKSPARRGRANHALQFCVQKHDATQLHYDFRLELDGTLKSWAVPKGPSLDPHVKRIAIHVEDHPLDYAAFEGHIPEGHYGAGDVIVWDRGVWVPDGDPAEAYRKGRLTFRLDGEKLAGRWHLVRTRLKGKQEQWLLIKSDDNDARSESEYDIVQALPDSVLSDRTLRPTTSARQLATRQAARKRQPETANDASAQAPLRKPVTTQNRRRSHWPALDGARAAPLPESLKPALATLVDAAPAGHWRYEIKFDGYRILARIDGDEVKLFTRNGNDWTSKMPRQAEALSRLGLDSAWLDGEVVVLDKAGLPNFQSLQNAFDARRSNGIVYYLFDVPYLNGMDLRNVPLEPRRATLTALLEHHEGDVLRLSRDFDESPESMLDSACEIQLEGVIGKQAGSLYASRRTTDWIKLKCKHRQEFVVVGYTEPRGSRQAFGALLLGLHDPDTGALRYAGKVGAGFSEATLQSVLGRLDPLRTRHAALDNPPSRREATGVHWTRPELLAEVAYAEMTREGIIRHAVFRGLRTDKPASNIGPEHAVPADAIAAAPARRGRARAGPPADAPPDARAETETVRGVRITHPQRIIDSASATTKRELAEYYTSIASRILPHLKSRPVALVRAPDGITGELFFQKDAGKLPIPHIHMLDKACAGQPVMTIDSAQALVGAAQMGAIELHTWNATTERLDQPDRFVLDLDPDPALPWKRMIEATQLTLAVLDELGLKSFLKTSGGKGIHLVVPLTPSQGWADVKGFTQALVQHMARQLPDRFSAVSGPRNRVGRIFIDYLTQRPRRDDDRAVRGPRPSAVARFGSNPA
ncbi:ATP-dependent DNA ligase (EC 6.5.1.1) (plasmid) [Mycetohabitans rhizoxinica HKI 454]|uniref:DNA ligase (ATP) n=1 Tax=Mycetohabitans rhizoxinica (strain DSM 19002 / CIP 109453 / HKI 454) TaxID=882378 RepID=E5ATY4_MYCRK|nr:ATP-dependent DNA ligase (EC 6.5.1.1) [Mycetohabitans rhizoxinica HKI 454]